MQGFKDYIQQQQEKLRTRGETDYNSKHTSVKIIADLLLLSRSWSKTGESHAFIRLIEVAWYVLSYDHFKPGSLDQANAGLDVSLFYRHNTMSKKGFVHLSERQAETVDALAKAAGIPYQKQTEVEIPENLRDYSNWVESLRRPKQTKIVPFMPKIK